jgi:hypothetical protein
MIKPCTQNITQQACKLHVDKCTRQHGQNKHARVGNTPAPAAAAAVVVSNGIRSAAKIITTAAALAAPGL